MKKLVYLLVVLGAISCEKVIEIPLNEADQRIVIEGQLYDLAGESFIKVSKTGSVYVDEGFEKVSGAQVVVSDDVGGVWNFIETPAGSGVYLDTSFIAQPNRVYDLNITSSGVNYTARSETFADVELDSLNYILQVGGGFGGQGDPNDTTYFTFYSFTDNASYNNYYRTIPFLEGDPMTPYLNDDKLFNGQTFTQPFFADQFRSGDTMTAFLISMDEANYKYYSSLESNQDGGPFSATPSNPVSNIEGDAIGFFGVYMTDTLTIIYP